MIKKEWKFIGKHHMIWISLIAIALIPFLYSIFFLRSVWDPYGETQHLPVAVVNEDKPVHYEGKKLAVGQQTVKKLKKNRQLGWRFVSAKQAQKGLKDQKYFTVVTIPKDFSKNAATALDKHPKKMKLQYQTNDSLNYIGSVISQMGVTKLNSQVRAAVTQAYAQAMFAGLHVITHGMQQAASGASQLNVGTVTLSDGLNQYTAAVSQVNDGVQTLSLNVAPLTNGIAQLKQQVQPLAGSVSQLSNGANQLSSGLAQLQNAVSASASGSQQAQLQQVVAALPQINSGLQQLNQTLQQTNTGALGNFQNNLAGIGSQTQTIGSNLQQASQTLASLNANTGSGVDVATSSQAIIGQINQELANQGTPLTADQQAIVSQAVQSGLAQGADSNTSSNLQPALQSVAGNLQAASAATQGIGANLQAVQQAQPQLQQIQGQLGQLQGSVQQLAQASNLALPGASQAINQLNSGVQGIQSALNGTGTQAGLTSGANQLASGLSQLNQSVPTLTNGIDQLDSGSQQLGSGVQQLASATGQLAASGEPLTSGAQQLLSGSGQLGQALNQGSQTLSQIKPTTKNAQMMAAPTKVQQHHYSRVSNYGHALAPYVLSVALYVGSIVFNFIYPIRRVSETGKPSWQWFLSKISVGAVIAVAMGVLNAGLMLVGGLQPDNLGEYFTIAILFSLTSMFLIMFLAMLLDNPGRFLAMVLLMLQLGGSGGTFPMPITSHFYNVIHPYLPMTYSINGFREALTSGLGYNTFVQAVIVLVSIIVISLALLYLSMDFLQRKHLAGKSELDGNQDLQAVEK